MATELASAYVTLMPSLKGAGRSIESQLSGIDISGVGAKLGASLTKGFDIDGVSDKLISAGNAASGLFKTIATPVVGGLAAIGGALAGITAQGGIARALKIEHANTLFKGIKMSAADIESAMNSADIAVTGTAFGLDSAAQAAAMLSVSGVELGDTMTKSLQAITGAAVMAGRPMEDMTQIFQKVATTGKLSGMELTQLSYAGINATAALAQSLGKSGEEIKEMVSDGEIDFATFRDAMYETFGEAAYGANDTFAGALANIQNNLSRLGAKFATPALGSLQGVFKDSIGAIKAFSATLDPLVERFTYFANNAVLPVRSALIQFTDDLSNGVPVADAFKNAMDRMLEGFETGINWEQLSTYISGVATALTLLGTTGPALTVAGTAMKTFSPAIDAFMTFGGSIASSVGGAITTIGGLGPKIGSAVKGAASNLSYFGTAALDAGSVFMTSLTAGFSDTGLGTAISSISEKISSAFGRNEWLTKLDIKDNLSRAFIEPFNGLKESVGSSINGLKEKFLNSGVGQSLHTAFVQPLASLKTQFNSFFGNPGAIIGESFKTAIGQFGSWFGGVFDGINSKVGGVLSSITGKAGEFASGALSKVGGVASSTVGGIAKLSVGLGAASAAFLAVGVAAVQSGVDIKQKANDMLTTAQDTFGQLPEVANMLKDVFPEIVQTVANAMPEMIQSLTVALSTIVEVLPTILPTLVDAISSMVQQLIPAIIDMVPLLLDAGIELFISLVEALTQIIPKIIERLPELIENVCTTLVQHLPELLSAGLTLFIAIASAIIEATPKILSTLWHMLPELGQKLKDFMPELLEKGKELFIKLKDAILETGPKILSKLGELGKDLFEKAKSFGSDMLDAGKNLIKGMIDGIKQKASDLINAAKGAINDAIEGAKNLLGINSPSKVFKGIGASTMEGFALGIAQNSKYAEMEMANAINKIADNDPIAFRYNTSMKNDYEGNGLAQGIVINLNYTAGDDANDMVRDIARGIKQYRMAGVL